MRETGDGTNSDTSKTCTLGIHVVATTRPGRFDPVDGRSRELRQQTGSALQRRSQRAQQRAESPLLLFLHVGSPHVFRLRATSAPDFHPPALVCDHIPGTAGTSRLRRRSLHILERRCARLVRDTSISSTNIIDVGWRRGGFGRRLVGVPDSD